MISFALVVLEDLFGSRKELIDLEKIGKLLQISINANSKKLTTTSRSVTKLTYNSGRCFTVVLFWQVNILFNGESLQLCIFLISTFLFLFPRSKYEEIDEHSWSAAASKSVPSVVVFSLGLGICWRKEHLWVWLLY